MGQNGLTKFMYKSRISIDSPCLGITRTEGIASKSNALRYGYAPEASFMIGAHSSGRFFLSVLDKCIRTVVIGCFAIRRAFANHRPASSDLALIAAFIGLPSIIGPEGPRA